MTITRTDSSNKDFIELIPYLDAELDAMDREAHTICSQYNGVEAIKNVVLAYSEGIVVGCGAIKKYSEDTMEVKRMFVRPECRGKSIASNVLKELEVWALELGYSICILETSYKLSDAIRLYEKSGYMQIPNYDQYENVDTSRCFCKKLK
ncbi:GNAT family N-acetyltransferase [Dysgonomonas sp. Marseille-Q5470]|uniref:GNAT family N-acetyltransferase n=1 Tax=Dysgonomonas sp. Marseille-Q5470 TaxID=3039494 RepID=UPI0024BD3055|nr:GNAT family N-acetyltransferase [Dysgonomonas sp. Marseille-Q5470]